MSRDKPTSRIEEEIERNLKRAFDDVAEQQLPSQLTDLLAQLKAQESQTAPDAKTGEGNGDDD